MKIRNLTCLIGSPPERRKSEIPHTLRISRFKMIEIVNRIGHDLGSIRWLRGVLRKILDEVRVQSSSTLSVAFVSRAEIQRLNRQYRKKNTPTNSLSFAYARSKRSPWMINGELVICPRVVLWEARDAHQSVREYMKVILVHGILHLLGYDHETDREAQRMQRKEDQVLSVCIRKENTKKL